MTSNSNVIMHNFQSAHWITEISLIRAPRGERQGAQWESCRTCRVGVMQRTLETMAGAQRLQGDRAWNRQRRSSLMKRPSSPSYHLDCCVVVFCGTSYMDGVIHVHIMASRDSTEFHCAHAKDIVSLKLHGESQHGNLRHCLSQEKQYSIIRTIFAPVITGRCE